VHKNKHSNISETFEIGQKTFPLRNSELGISDSKGVKKLSNAFPRSFHEIKWLDGWVLLGSVVDD
jgi:hypothetical protein